MKENVGAADGLSGLKPRELLLAVLSHASMAVAGLIASRAVVLGGCLPFGLSLLAGCPVIYTPSVAVGIFFGYIIPAAGDSAFRYIASLFALLAIRLLTGGYKKIADNPVFLSGVCLACAGLTSVVALSGTDGSVPDIAAEVLLAAGATYFVSKCCRALSDGFAGLAPDELASLLITVSILLTGLSGLELAGISLGRILAVMMILSAAKYGGTLSGAVSGIAVSFSLTLSGADGAVCTAYAFGGLMAGVFSALGKYAQIAAVMVSCFVGAAAGGMTLSVAQMSVETALGAALFVVLPRSAGIFLGRLFSAYPKLSVPAGLKKALTLRLLLASNALKDVSGTVEQVSRELSRINAPDFGTVISGVERDACAGCKLRLHCWESRKEDTTAAMLEMTKAVKRGDTSPEESATVEFKGRCLRVQRIGAAVYRHYSDYASRISAENRIDEVRSVVSDQFNGISSMLCELASDFEDEEQFDNSAAVTAAAALKNLGIQVDECSSRIDRFGRITVELKVKKTPELIINRLQVMKQVSVACERDFDIPGLSEAGNDIFIVLSEHADLTVDIGVQQYSASGSSMCGDACNYFNDGRGHFIMVLSDGMGTGGRAAVDGAMASGLMTRLIKAGFGYDCSLRILNSSMLFKSTDESLATVDIASIDLYTGHTELYKAGAAPTLVRRSGRTGKAESTSLPAGILREIGFDRAAVRMKAGDIIVLMSDGAVSEGTDWIRAELEVWRDGSAEELADRLCESARRRRSDSHEDDITVMAAIINRAV